MKTLRQHFCCLSVFYASRRYIFDLHAGIALFIPVLVLFDPVPLFLCSHETDRAEFFTVREGRIAEAFDSGGDRRFFQSGAGEDRILDHWDVIRDGNALE